MKRLDEIKLMKEIMLPENQVYAEVPLKASLHKNLHQPALGILQTMETA